MDNFSIFFREKEKGVGGEAVVCVVPEILFLVNLFKYFRATWRAEYCGRLSRHHFDHRSIEMATFRVMFLVYLLLVYINTG